MQTRTITTYKFHELTDEAARERALSWGREGFLDYPWWDFVYEDAKTIGALMGIEIAKIYFSGFWSQGDGACFEGEYAYVKGSVKAVKDHAPQDKRLHEIAERLQAIQKPNFYLLEARVKQTGRYSHEYCTDIVVWNRDADSYDEPVDAEEVRTALRDFMRWIYRQLEQEYEYLSSDEQMGEFLSSNEYDFDEHGQRCVRL